MYIVRVQSGDVKKPETRTFSFESEKDMDFAASLLKRTGCRGFSAEADDAGAVRGKVHSSWEFGRFNGGYCFFGLDKSDRPYSDSESCNFGYRDECERDAAETNAKAISVFSTTARVERVAGDLYKVIYRTPFND